MFAQGSALWNVNTGLCVKPEEPIFTGDKTPPTPGAEEVEEEKAAGRSQEGDLKFNRAAKGPLYPQINPVTPHPHAHPTPPEVQPCFPKRRHHK